jgi:hypothetical protein
MSKKVRCNLNVFNDVGSYSETCSCFIYLKSIQRDGYDYDFPYTDYRQHMEVNKGNNICSLSTPHSFSEALFLSETPRLKVVVELQGQPPVQFRVQG